MNFTLPAWLKPEITLLIITIIMLFSGLNRFELRTSTEPREAGIAADMLQNNQFLVPTLNGEPFLEKPPLSYWLQAMCINVFGYQPFSPRIPSVIAGLSIIGLFIFFFRKMDDSKLFMLTSGLLLISMASFWVNAREAGQDILLTLGISLALLAFYFTRENQPRLNWLLFSLGIAIATLTKGVIGLAIPGVTIFVFLVIETILVDKKIVILNWVYPALFTLLGLLPISIWLWELYSAQGFETVKEVLWTNSVGRFAGDYSKGAHAEPFYYYLTKIPETFQPWTILLYLAGFNLAKTITHNKRNLLFFCWLMAPFILLSLSAGKRPTYLLMIYPAAAALIARFISDLATRYSKLDSVSSVKYAKNTKLVLAVESALFILISCFIVFKLVKVHAPILAAISACGLSFLIYHLWQSISKIDLIRFSGTSIGIVMITYLSYFSVVVAHEDTKESAKKLVTSLNNYATAEHSIALFKPSERIAGATIFYLQHRVPALTSEAELLQAVQSHSFVLISSQEKVDFSRYNIVEKLKYAKQDYYIVSLN